MEERRKLKRCQIMLYSRVFDRKTGKLLGYLGNITINGMMIISEDPLRCQVDFKLRMDLPDDIYTQTILNLNAYSLWCQQDIDPNFYNTGLKFVALDEIENQIIEQILVDYRIRD